MAAPVVTTGTAVTNAGAALVLESATGDVVLLVTAVAVAA